MKPLGANIYLTDKQMNIIYNSLADISEKNVNDTWLKILAQTYNLSPAEYIQNIEKIKKKIFKGRR